MKELSFACPWGLLVSLWGAGSCAAGSAPAGVHPSAQGGVLAAGDPGIGYLRVLRNDNGSAYYDWCTATMISPVVVLTAAHCMPRPGTTDTFDGFYTGPGTPSSPGELAHNLTWHGITEFAIYPGDSDHPGSDDFANAPYGCPAPHVDLAVVRIAPPIDMCRCTAGGTSPPRPGARGAPRSATATAAGRAARRT